MSSGIEPVGADSPRSYGLAVGYGVLVVGATAATAFAGLPVAAVAGFLGTLTLCYALRKYIFSWIFLLFAMLAMIMYVPARAYALPIPLPFHLEPYRALWVIGVGIVLYATLIRGVPKWRPVSFGIGIGAYLVTVLVSFVFNASTLTQQGLVGGAVGGVLTFLMQLVPLVIARQVIGDEQTARRALTFMTWSGAIVAVVALFEYATRINIFRLYANFLPLTLLRDELEATTTGGAFRAFGSAQHPIALAVMLATLIPVGLWLARWAPWPHNPINRQIVYGALVIMLFGGMMSAISRTAVINLGAMFIAGLLLRPRLALRLLAAAVPLMGLLALLRPNLFRTVFLSFLDLDSLVASQNTSPGWRGQGRLADIGPALEIVSRQPFFGTGLGSRIVVGENANSFILDNQWLATLMELGVIGVLGLAVFMLTPVVKLVRHAHRTDAEQRHSDLAVAIAVSTVGYTVVMYFFDAFSFVQSFLVLSILWAIGGWILNDAAPARTGLPRRAITTPTQGHDA